MWSRLVKIQYTELKLSCGNNPVVKNSIYSNGDLDLWPNDPKINRMLTLPQGNQGAKIGKDPIYKTKVIMRNDPVVKKSIYSNSDLDLWPNDPKINRIISLPQGIMWPRLVVKIQYTELKLSCGNDPIVKKYIYSNGDLHLWTNDPKINMVLPLPQGNHVTKFGKDLIYRTKVIVRKPVWTPARHTKWHNTAPSLDGRMQSYSFWVLVPFDFH